MSLEQFNLLQQLVKESADLIVRLKFENNTLKEKNEKLQEEVKDGTFKSVQKLKRLETENNILKQRQEKVTSRLMHLRNKVKSLTEGVES
jgi:FtsZ-binding cell division protein ZapB